MAWGHACIRLPSRLEYCLVADHIVGKVMFSLVCVILFTGRGLCTGGIFTQGVFTKGCLSPPPPPPTRWPLPRSVRILV